jgi:hypothetical protein
MTNVFCLWWDNGQEYEDHSDELVGVFSSRDRAVAYLGVSMLSEGARREGKYSVVEMALDPTVKEG